MDYMGRTFCRLAVGAQSRLCEVNPKFRCVVVVDCDTAYQKLDAPLLNRFEKQVIVLCLLCSRSLAAGSESV